MDLRSLVKSSFLYAVGNVAIRIVGFLMIPVYTRFLTTSDYGLIELIDLVTNVAAIAFGLNAMGSAMIRIYHDRKDPAWQASVISSSIITLGGGGILLCVLGVAVAPWLARSVIGSDHYTTLLQATFITLVAGNVLEVCLTYLRIKDRALHFVLFSFANLVVTLALNIWFIVYMGLGVWGFVLSKVIASGLGTAYLLLITLRDVGIRWNGEAVRRMIRFGSPLIVASLSSFAVHFLDRFILNHEDSLGTVGIYSLAYKFGFMITYFVGTPFHRAWNARLYAHTDEEGWRERFGNVLRLLTFFLLFAWVGLSALVDEAITVMATPPYHAAMLFVPWIALGYACRAVGDFFRTILFINKRSGLTTKIGISCALLNTGLNFLLIPRWGAWGATWATLATWCYFMGVSWFLAQREHHLHLPYRSMAVMCVLALGLYGLSSLLSQGTLPIRVIVSLAVALLFPPLVWFAGCFTTSQKETVRQVWRTVRSRLPLLGTSM